MKLYTAATILSLTLASSSAFTAAPPARPATRLASSAPATATAAAADGKKTQDPLLIRAARGEKVERTPVWMMRQAGRHIKEYRDLCKKYPTFRERSEIPEVAVEVSLQPWRNYQTDGCILFSDILTPLPGIGCEFVIDEKVGPIMTPIRSYDEAKKVRTKSLKRSIVTANNSHTFYFLDFRTDAQARPHRVDTICRRSAPSTARGRRTRDGRFGLCGLPVHSRDVYCGRKDFQGVLGNQEDGHDRAQALAHHLADFGG